MLIKIAKALIKLSALVHNTRRLTAWRAEEALMRKQAGKEKAARAAYLQRLADINYGIADATARKRKAGDAAAHAANILNVMKG